MRLLLILATALMASAAERAARTSNTTPVKFTIYSGYTAVFDANGRATAVSPCAPGSDGCVTTLLTGDGRDYGDGDADSCVIHNADGAFPTFDATCGLERLRYLKVELSQRVAVNNNFAQPAWATSTLQGRAGFNVQHIVRFDVFGDTNAYDFTTRMNLNIPPGDGFNIQFRSTNPIPETPPAYYIPADFTPNDSYQTALVRIYHCPDTIVNPSAVSATCPAGRKESWWVFPDPANALDGDRLTLTRVTNPASRIGSLVYTSNRGQRTVAGQYSLPFLLKVELK